MAERLDQALVKRGLIDSRERAQALIMEGRVYIFENKALKPSQKVEDSDEVTIRGELNPFVSRGGHKLAKAMDVFAINAQDVAAVDIGASTGGFTDVLLRAGIDRTDAVVSCMRSDEANIVVAHVARSTFRVPRVIARLHDLTKADTYRRLNIQTVSPNAWGIARIGELLTYNHLDNVFEVGSGDVRLVRADVPALLDGTTVREISALGEVQIVSISHDNETFIPTQGTVLAAGDIIYAAVATSASRKFKQMLGITD